MVRFIVLTFGFMGLGFYELSGGSEFQPAEWRAVSAPTIKTQPLTEAGTDLETEVVNAPIAVKPEPTVASQPAAKVVFASVPTTRRLVGASAPTPATQKTTLGPELSVETKQKVETNVPATLTHEVEIAPDFRRVTGNRVNMRNGPGTQYSVVGKLLRDDEVEVLQDPGIGWVKLQVMETGRIGWMSSKLLAKVSY